jgi:predicted nucleotidyltransferase
VPFGAIQDESGAYIWPPDFMSGMNVAGFMEINEDGTVVESPDKELRFRVAPIHGICIMKFFAWKDRKYKTDKDAKDLAFIPGNYLDLKEDLLFDKYIDIATDDNYDTIISAGRVLGRDINEILFTNPVVLNQVRGIIENELMDEEECLLARKMASVKQFNYAKSYSALKSILAGIDDSRSTV